jgi:preprotein translocase subunit Sec63
VPRDASTEDIGVAYQEARLKYDPDHVTHLSIDVQEHYKAKAEAVDRAYLKLSESS